MRTCSAPRARNSARNPEPAIRVRAQSGGISRTATVFEFVGTAGTTLIRTFTICKQQLPFALKQSNIPPRVTFELNFKAALTHR
jgi:hypothetical protein